MSQLVSRILLAIFLFPLAAVFYLIIFFILDHNQRYGSYRDIDNFFICGVVTWIGVALYWWLLWRSSVKWNGVRVGLTVAAVLLCAICAAIVAGLIALATPNRNGDFAMFVATVLAILLWLVATVFLWRETAAERSARLVGAGNAVTCPHCGYNLTGLHESRCPECGTKFTLDELLVAQRAKAADIA